MTQAMAIYYCCTDFKGKSAGNRLIYRHVEVLNRHCISAFVLHGRAPFRMEDAPDVPIRYVDDGVQMNSRDVLLVSEVLTKLLPMVKDLPVRRMILALSWDYLFQQRVHPAEWKNFGIERVLVNSPYVAELVSRTTGIPTTLISWGVNPKHYFPQDQKRTELVYIERKQDRVEALKGILAARDGRFVTQWKWTGLDGASEAEYAAVVRGAAVYLNLSRGEALPVAMLEAMRCRTLVAGYDSVGGRGIVEGDGPRQNAIVAATMDYPDLARRLEPILQDILRGDLSRCEEIVTRAYRCSLKYDWDEEEKSIVQIWRALL